ncbi:TetR family transcriptional regulator [Mycobacterium sp. MFM001]|uniref:TetR/AcrR family transcriptional regulator n=1 Tax=Mycobacterium sp. MFM001 TaxID=2049453 RepID=UPI000DA592F3|nr:TetR/AcrR family transcriptional regulator [Mycobacterium sp. MFM001]GBE64588.1 TetR family transcriptional regulator [Mycobacterium sp. MFM001]
MTRPPSLRERKKLDTRKAISDAALTLVFERGLDNVTRDDIAARAGVSVRTFSNYFTGKYDALAYRQIERVRRGLAALRQRPHDEPLWSAISAAVLESMAADGDLTMPPDHAQLAEVRKLLLAPEVRMAVSKEVFADWVRVIAARSGTDPDRDLYPRLVVGVIRAVVEAAMDAYADADPPVSMAVLLRRGFADVAAGLPVPGRTTTGGT